MHGQRGVDMVAILRGNYKDGRIELDESPADLRAGRVQVVVIQQEQPPSSRRFLTFGKFSKGQCSTFEDFKAAEWHGEQEFEDSDGQ